MAKNKARKKIIKMLEKKEFQSSFNRLAANIRFYSQNNKAKSFSIASALKDEGKTTVAVSLATCLADKATNVLIVDFDIHHKSLSDMFLPNSAASLFDVFSNKCVIEDAILKTTTEGLYFIDFASGVSSIQSLVGTSEFINIWKVLKNSFDYIIVDTPPVLPCLEATVACKLTDACIQVVRRKKTSKDDVLTAYDQLKTYGVDVIGSVATFTKNSESKYYSSYSYYN